MTSPRDALPTTIATARLTLRAPTLGDLDALVALANNPNVIATTASLPFPYEREHGLDFIEQFSSQPENRTYAVIDADQHFMGVVGLKFAEGKTPELGYWLGEPYWGRGYVSEAVAGLLQAAPASGLWSMVARVLADNAASLRVLEKSGFAITERTTSVVERHAGKPLLILNWTA